MQAVKGAERIGPGTRVGKLTVREATPQRSGGCVVWRCDCECGGSILLDTRQLRRGTRLDCGCGGDRRGRRRDLSGQRFGRLMCLEPARERSASGGTLWYCRCDCGNICLAEGAQLTRGYKRSCGCLHRPRTEEFLGRRFGRLLVTGYAGKSGGKHMWSCACDCGGSTVVAQGNLANGHTKSCGCLQREIYRENLKLVDGTSVAMIENRKKRPIKSNTSGVSGVYYSRRMDAWCAQITFKGTTYYLGKYGDIEDAIEARRAGEQIYDRFLDWYYHRGGVQAP